jgi:hypothetical protein
MIYGKAGFIAVKIRERKYSVVKVNLPGAKGFKNIS